MPWTGKSFAAKHNHSLSGGAAKAAAKQASAMVRSGVPEGEAIATANKRAKAHRTNGSSPRSMDEHMAKQRTQGRTVAKIAGDFGKSPTTVSRRTLRQGFVRKGSAV